MQRLVAQAARRRDVRLRQQAIDLVEVEKLRQRRPRARRLQVGGGTLLELSLEREKPIEAAHARDRRAPPIAATAPASSGCGQTLRARAASSASTGCLARLGERRERREVARVALDGVRRHPPHVAEVGDVGVDHGDSCRRSAFGEGLRVLLFRPSTTDLRAPIAEAADRQTSPAAFVSSTRCRGTPRKTSTSIDRAGRIGRSTSPLGRPRR